MDRKKFWFLRESLRLSLKKGPFGEAWKTTKLVRNLNVYSTVLSRGQKSELIGIALRSILGEFASKEAAIRRYNQLKRRHSGDVFIRTLFLEVDDRRITRRALKCLLVLGYSFRSYTREQSRSSARRFSSSTTREYPEVVGYLHPGLMDKVKKHAEKRLKVLEDAVYWAYTECFQEKVLKGLLESLMKYGKRPTMKGDRLENERDRNTQFKSFCYLWHGIYETEIGGPFWMAGDDKTKLAAISQVIKQAVECRLLELDQETKHRDPAQETKHREPAQKTKHREPAQETNHREPDQPVTGRRVASKAACYTSMESIAASIRGCTNVKELDKIYKRASLFCHPDKGGKKEEFQSLRSLIEKRKKGIEEGTTRSAR